MLDDNTLKYENQWCQYFKPFFFKLRTLDLFELYLKVAIEQGYLMNR